MLFLYSLLPFVLVNGNSKIVEVKNKTPEEIKEWIERLRNESGVKVQKIRQFWHTENPSIQGTWTPFLNKPPSLRRSTVHHLAAEKQASSWVTCLCHILKVFLIKRYMKTNTFTTIHKDVIQDIVGNPKAFKCLIPGASTAVLVSSLLKRAISIC